MTSNIDVLHMNMDVAICDGPDLTFSFRKPPVI